MPAGFHQITLNVTDLARSRVFYEGLPGLRVDQGFPGEKLRLPDASLTGLGQAAGRPSRR